MGIFTGYGITEGVYLEVAFKSTGIWPPKCTGIVEKVYPKFALIRTKTGYRTTVHRGDLTAGYAVVSIIRQAKRAV